jgi:hypothetical protein
VAKNRLFHTISIRIAWAPIYQELCPDVLRLGAKIAKNWHAAMTFTVADTASDTRLLRASLPLWVGVVTYAVLIVTGDRLLLDPDTQWQITVGQWIIDHRVVPHTDVYSFTLRGAPWISTQWLAQLAYAEVYAWFGWTGPVVLA